MLVYYSMIYEQLVNGLIKSWLLDINLSKFKVMHVGISTSNYYINDTLISVSTSEKILGVFLDDDLSFKIHLFGVVKKSGQMRNFLLLAFHGLNNNIIISLYKVYVRSLLDYAFIIYSPYYMYLIDL